ncbi:hypothetical protein AAVH_21313 [Aphelenchoides avenae]|nr:hypothetical protein AAVH_21313 [Aphelenchus avenae]
MDASSLLKDLECPICLHVLTDPVVLPACGHSLCAACLKRLLTGNSHDATVDGLPKAFQFAGMIESLKALCSPTKGWSDSETLPQFDDVSLVWSSLSVVTTTSKGVENRVYMGQDRSAAFEELRSVIRRSHIKNLTIRDASFPTVSISPEQWATLWTPFVLRT